MSIDFIDYTMLQKRGFLKKAPEAKSDIKVNSDGMIDFTQMQNTSSNASTNTASTSSSPFDFLNSMAGVGASSPSSIPAIFSSSSDTNSELNALKFKLEDTEYKLERLVERLAKIEEKLGVI